MHHLITNFPCKYSKVKSLISHVLFRVQLTVSLYWQCPLTIDLLPWFDLYQYFGSLQRGYFREGDDAKTIVLEAKKFLLKGYKLRPKRRLRTDESIRVSGESLQHKPQFLFLLLKHVVKSLLKVLQSPNLNNFFHKTRAIQQS